MAEINSRHSSFMSKVNSINILDYLTNHSLTKRENDSKNFIKRLWGTAKDLFKKDLTGHYGCVNAIEFSSDGNLLFSGGDDRRVFMWNVNSAMMYYTGLPWNVNSSMLDYAGKLGVGSKPKIMEACHFSNVFCLAVDDFNKRVLSGSNDDQVIVHDYTTGAPVDNFLHYSPVFSLSLHPKNGNIFASAADNGRILIYDIRESTSDPLCLAKFRTPFHGVMFNPCEPFLIATANSKLGVHIWDLRKPKEILQECSDKHSMAVRWNQAGNILLALRNLLPPIIYNPLCPKSVLEFDADGYFNACTMKSCSFAGDKDEYILSGSDDFNLYMWKIPDPWPTSKWIPNAHLTLTGHRSIVNQVRYDPNKQLIASSGVEKIIKLWSPFRMPYSDGDRDKPCQKRSRVLCSLRACSRSPVLLHHDYSQGSVDEDTRMIHFFDSLLRKELNGTASSSFSQFYCFDGKLFPISTRKRENKAYEQFIMRKKNHLSKVLTGKNDDSPPVCSLSQVSNTVNNHPKRNHFTLRASQLLNASENERNAEESSDPSQAPLESENTSSVNVRTTSISPASSENNMRSSSSSSPSSSSTSSSAISNTRLESMLGSPYGSESHLSSDQSGSDAVSRTSRSESPPDLATRRRYYFSNSESEDSNPAEENSFKYSGVNVSTSSESDNLNGSSSFKKRFINKQRCYRNSGRRKTSASSENSVELQSPAKRRKTSSVPESSTSESRNNSNNDNVNTVCDQKTKSFDSSKSSFECEPNNTGNYSKDGNDL